MVSISNIKNLIAQLKKEDEDRKIEYEKQLAEQDKKYNELFDKVSHIKDESKNYMDKIVNGLDELIANKHTIEKALEQTEKLEGLPIPQDQHEAAVDLISKMTCFMNNTDALKKTNKFSPDDIHKDVQTVIEAVSSDLNECHTGLVQAQSLYHNTKLLKNLMKENEGDETQKLDSPLYTIAEN